MANDISEHSGTNLQDKLFAIPNKVNKTGDTMTGALVMDNNSRILINTTIDNDVAPTDTFIASGMYGFNSAEIPPALIGYIQAEKTVSGFQGVKLSTQKMFNGEKKEHYLALRISDNGAQVYVNNKVAWQKAINAFPVGSVVCMATNSPPQYGSWQLIDKEFKYTYVNSFTPTLNSTNCSSASVYGFYHGHNIFVAWQCVTKVALNDNEFTMFTIDPNKFGVSNFSNSRIVNSFSDGGNSIIRYSFSSAGVVSINDVISRNASNFNSVAANTSLMTVTTDFSAQTYNSMLDSACNKFYFRRVS